MRTNIILDDELVKEAFEYSQARSKAELVREALRTFIQTKVKERRRARYAERLQEVQRELGKLRFRQSARDLIQEDRNSR